MQESEAMPPGACRQGEVLDCCATTYVHGLQNQNEAIKRLEERRQLPRGVRGPGCSGRIQPRDRHCWPKQERRVDVVGSTHLDRSELRIAGRQQLLHGLLPISKPGVRQGDRPDCSSHAAVGPIIQVHGREVKLHFHRGYVRSEPRSENLREAGGIAVDVETRDALEAVAGAQEHLYQVQGQRLRHHEIDRHAHSIAQSTLHILNQVHNRFFRAAQLDGQVCRREQHDLPVHFPGSLGKIGGEEQRLHETLSLGFRLQGLRSGDASQLMRGGAQIAKGVVHKQALSVFPRPRGQQGHSAQSAGVLERCTVPQEIADSTRERLEEDVRVSVANGLHDVQHQQLHL
eukprot:scaffold462_cov195-Pinguiococcus_pyrenoidosus.AAC.31